MVGECTKGGQKDEMKKMEHEVLETGGLYNVSAYTPVLGVELQPGQLHNRVLARASHGVFKRPATVQVLRVVVREQLHRARQLGLVRDHGRRLKLRARGQFIRGVGQCAATQKQQPCQRSLESLHSFSTPRPETKKVLLQK